VHYDVAPFLEGFRCEILSWSSVERDAKRLSWTIKDSGYEAEGQVRLELEESVDSLRLEIEAVKMILRELVPNFRTGMDLSLNQPNVKERIISVCLLQSHLPPPPESVHAP
jgi:hypothetical protein